MDGANACLEDFLFFCNSEVDLALKIRMLRKIDGQCYFVSFPDLNLLFLLSGKRMMVLPDP